MGFLKDGKWVDQWHDTRSTGGRYQRQPSKFRNWITPDGSPGPTGRGGFRAEAGRYHLYVSWACPWAHRTLILRALKGLGDMISISAVNPVMRSQGWTFEPGEDVIADTVNGASRLYEVYLKADPAYEGRVTVPTLWDRETGTIVNNESSEIIRMFNSAFDGIGALAGDYYPQNLRGEIDEVNEYIYRNINNGVYRSGFATTQEAYVEAVTALFDTLDGLDRRLARQRYLVGERLTEADWRFLPTLVRFDAVYYGHFKCNLRRIADYDHLSGYVRELYQVPGIAETVLVEHTKRHYYMSHRTINPTGIVPVGPELDFTSPHGRERLEAA